VSTPTNDRVEAQPSWPDGRVSWGSALRDAVRPPSLRRSAIAASVVGTTLLMVNLSGRLIGEPFTVGLALKVFLTYAVPWGNATVGIAMGLRGHGS
jgi:hypothetical protein